MVPVAQDTPGLDTHKSLGGSMRSDCGTNEWLLSWPSTILSALPSSNNFAKKSIREMSEIVRWFGAVSGAGIVNGNSEFFSLLFVLCPIPALHTAISSVYMTCSFMSFLHSLIMNSTV